MKTYKKIEENPRLVISYDEDAENPRDFGGNLGYFITCDNKHFSPDGRSNPTLQTIVKNTADQANNQAEHIQLIGQALADQCDGELLLKAYPVTKYEHSGVSYSLGTEHGFDNSNNGFYIITDKTAKLYSESDPAKFEAIIKSELDTYNKWVNGEVYGFILYNEAGEVEESCWGFYDIEDIREHLPKDWQDEKLSDYLI